VTIVASETVTTSIQGSRIRSRLRFQDHLGLWHYTSHSHPIGLDVDAFRVAYEVRIADELDKSEQTKAPGRVLAGEDSLVVAQSSIHSTEVKLMTRLVKWMMRAGMSDDPETRKLAATIIIGMEPLLIYINTTFTDAQIRNNLNITQAQLTRMRSRVGKILNAGATSPKDEMIAIADSAEDWE